MYDLLQETLSHFKEGARSVYAHTDVMTYIITPSGEPGQYWITTVEPGFRKTKTDSLEIYFKEVFGIEAKY